MHWSLVCVSSLSLLLPFAVPQIQTLIVHFLITTPLLCYSESRNVSRCEKEELLGLAALLTFWSFLNKSFWWVWEGKGEVEWRRKTNKSIRDKCVSVGNVMPWTFSLAIYWYSFSFHAQLIILWLPILVFRIFDVCVFVIFDDSIFNSCTALSLWVLVYIYNNQLAECKMRILK